MKDCLKYTILLVVLLFTSCNDIKKSKQSDSPIFPRGEKVTNANFTGIVYLKSLVEIDSLNQSSIGNVTFEPISRTKWHMHPAGQILLVIDGVGYYQEEGKEKQILNKGDVIKCPPKIKHWHGASPDKYFVQIAITNGKNGGTVWYDEVIDKEYLD